VLTTDKADWNDKYGPLRPARVTAGKDSDYKASEVDADGNVLPHPRALVILWGKPMRPEDRSAFAEMKRSVAEGQFTPKWIVAEHGLGIAPPTVPGKDGTPQKMGHPNIVAAINARAVAEEMRPPLTPEEAKNPWAYFGGEVLQDKLNPDSGRYETLDDEEVVRPRLERVAKIFQQELNWPLGVDFVDRRRSKEERRNQIEAAKQDLPLS